MKRELKIRAVTAFLNLCSEDFDQAGSLQLKVENTAQALLNIVTFLRTSGYEVQTYRIATNPFREYLPAASEPAKLKRYLSQLDCILEANGVHFFALGNAVTEDDIKCIPYIIAASHRFSCSADIKSGQDTSMAQSAAECIKNISVLGETGEFKDMHHVVRGLGNFRFCTVSCCKPFIPFFPAAKSCSQEKTMIPFAIGLENGEFAYKLLREAGSIENIPTIFKDAMSETLSEVVNACKQAEVEHFGVVKFVGVDTSLNPSLEPNGSIAAAIENIDIVEQFGGRGSIAVAAAITDCLKTLPEVPTAGYCGLMLPVCEDQRLARLVSTGDLDTTKLLAISSVCGVGLDTIPVPGDATVDELMALILDVASLAHRYNKSLSCRVFPCPGLKAGDETKFNSPYMCDCKVLKLS
jgi:uncharacterized protein (UPF0210 family)